MKEKEVSFNGRKLAYCDNEKKTSISIFMAHGNSYSGECFGYYFRRLGKKYRVVAIDFMNHGRSDKDDNFTEWGFYANQILTVLTHLKIDQVVGLGHSMGAIALIKAAHQAPDKFLQIITLDPIFLNMFKNIFSRLLGNPYGRSATKRKKIFKSKKILMAILKKYPLTKKWDLEILNDYINSCYNKTKEGMLLCCDPTIEAKNFHTPSYNSIKQAKSLTIPLHLIIPENSEVCSQKMAHRVTKNNCDATIIIREKAGHHFPFEEPEWTLQEIKKIMNGNINTHRLK